MATASIVLSTSTQNAVSVVRIDNRGSGSSIESDLAECFGSLSSIPTDDPPRLGALICEWYGNHATVNPSVPTEADYGDSTHALLDCSTPDASGRPTGELLTPATGSVSPLDYGI